VYRRTATGNQMSTRAVRAERIKDVVLPLMQRGGAVQAVSGMRVVQLSTGRFEFVLRTPFSVIPAAKTPSYSNSLARQHTSLEKTYGLDIWYQRKKAMSLVWSENVPTKLVSFKSRPWEIEALALSISDEVHVHEQ
jgi:hypothetical protein